MATIIQRINDLLKANLHHMVDQAEDPERMLKQIIREMEDNSRDAKVAVISAIASEKQLFNQLQEHRAKSGTWTNKAEYALRHGQEDLARTALARKLDHERIAEGLEPSWAAAKSTSEKLKEQLLALEAKKIEACRRRTGLIARQRAARAQQSLSKTLINFQDSLETQAKFAHMEDRVAEAEAQAQAIAEIMDDHAPLEREFFDMETKMKVAEELAALKRKIQAYP